MTMNIDLGNLEGTLPFEFSITNDELEPGSGDLSLKGDAKAAGEITRHPGQADVNGTITAETEMQCTRCLSVIEKKLEVFFSVSYVTQEQLPEGHSLEIEAGDLDTDVLTGDSLDLKELVREQILLNQPEQIFCKEDCKGLCQKCGANQNLIDCNCEEKETDPRWAALKNLN